MKKKLTALSAALISVFALSAFPVQAAVTFSDGDVNGDGKITSYDALLAQQYLHGYWYTENDSQLNALDVNNDYIIDYIDVQTIIDKSVGM